MSIQVALVPDTYFSSYPKPLRDMLGFLVSEPDTVELLEEVKERQGKIDLEVGNSTSWNWNEKKIILNRRLLSSKENLMAHLLFELNNAILTENYIKIKNNTQDVDRFVRSFEIFEHRSALKTREIILKILGKDVEFDFKWVHRHFDLHYAVQQIEGHSERIAAYYFPQKIYKGTLKCPLQELNKEERNHLYALLYYDVRANKTQFERTYSILKDRSVECDSCKKVFECAKVLFSTNEDRVLELS